MHIRKVIVLFILLIEFELGFFVSDSSLKLIDSKLRELFVLFYQIFVHGNYNDQ